MSFTEEYKKRKEEFEEYLRQLTYEFQTLPSELSQAVTYSLLCGGKRLRPVLLLEAVRMFGGDPNGAAVNFALAIECIHTYSLVHDDLPCMDNDDFRRGQLTCHKKFGEALAVLAGDALLNLSHELILGAIDLEDNNRDALIKAGAVIAKAAGGSGMVGGQSRDILTSATEQTIDYVYEKKTAALISAALEAGALIGGATAKEAAQLGEFGKIFGFGFQLKDDLLDGENDSQNTYLKLFGKEQTKNALKEHTVAATNILHGVKNSEFLTELTIHFMERTE